MFISIYIAQTFSFFFFFFLFDIYGVWLHIYIFWSHLSEEIRIQSFAALAKVGPSFAQKKGLGGKEEKKKKRKPWFASVIFS